MAVTLQPLPPEQAIAAFEARGQRLAPSFAWQDVWQDQHAAMFTVAKSAGFDILKDIHDELGKALKNGTTFEAFAKNLKPTLQAKGWWGRADQVDPLTGRLSNVQLGSTRRLRTIFDVNMRVSYAAGHWQNFERLKARRPHLRYVAILDGRTRPEHAARHNVVRPVDDPFWDTWAPPCGWACRCTLQSLSDRNLASLGAKAKEPPPDVMVPYRNKRTGETVQVPKGIDPGWGYNPGKAGADAFGRARDMLAEKAADPAAPPALRDAARKDLAGVPLSPARQGELERSLAQTTWGRQGAAAIGGVKLEAAEAQALHAYTFVREEGGARAVNDALRQGAPGALAALIALQKRALSKLPPVPGTSERWADLPDADIQRMAETGEYSDPAFLSSSMAPSQLEAYFTGRRHRLIVRGRSGRSIAEFSTFDQAEVLYSPGTRFRVIDMAEDRDGRWTIEIEEE